MLRAEQTRVRIGGSVSHLGLSRGLLVGFALVSLGLLAGCSRTTTSATPNESAPGSVTTSTIPSSESTAQSTTTELTTTTSSSTTTTTTIPLVTEGAVVMVANASGLPGGAARLSDQLASAGFAMNDPTNADGNEERLDVSKVYYLPQGQQAAQSIALVMGGVVVGPMPTPAWIEGANAALGNTTVLVMLGKDLAGQVIPGLTNR